MHILIARMHMMQWYDAIARVLTPYAIYIHNHNLPHEENTNTYHICHSPHNHKTYHLPFDDRQMRFNNEDHIWSTLKYKLIINYIILVSFMLWQTVGRVNNKSSCSNHRYVYLPRKTMQEHELRMIQRYTTCSHIITSKTYSYKQHIKQSYGLRYHFPQNSDQTTYQQQQPCFVFLVWINYMFINYETYIEDVKHHYIQLLYKTI
jgi:hypothetical protein